MSNYKINLKIAGTIIQLQSRFPQEQLTEEKQKGQAAERFDSFFYKGNQKPDILIDIEVVDKLPNISNTKPVFITYHFQDKKENWRLLKQGNSYIYKCPLDDKRQVVLVNKDFDKAHAYLLPKKNKSQCHCEEPRRYIGAARQSQNRDCFAIARNDKKGISRQFHKSKVWNITDIIYDFLQVLLINYFAYRNQGIFTHSVGIKDLDGSGLLFAGKSGAGKSTTARLWHKHSKAMVLNDDRIIIRKINNKFVMYGSPWHGEFSDYLASRVDSAALKKILFIRHFSKNIATAIPPKQAFSRLYPALFPAFWDKNCLGNIAAFCDDLIKNVPCYNLGFVNNKEVIDFVRDANRR